MEVRLNKFIARAGVCSRREADELITQKCVTVNGEAASSGMKVSEGDVIVVKGRILEAKPPVMIAFYKPRGVVCSTSEKDRAVTFDRYLDLKEHLFPVGRLDKDSEGLLLLTNMGDLSERIARAGTSHEKEYIVACTKPVSESFIDRMGKGVTITIPAGRSTTGRREIYKTRPCRVTKIDDFTFDIILTEGKNRQIRRMCEALSNSVSSLKRVRIMNIKLGSLKEGETRIISPGEIDELEDLL